MNDKTKPDEEEKAKNEHVEDGEEDFKSPTIGEIIDKFLHRVFDIEECALKFIEQADIEYNENADRIRDEVRQHLKIVENHVERESIVAASRSLRKLMRETERHNNSSMSETLERSLFVSLFSSFDKFIGDLVIALYNLSPESYKGISREISLSDALKFETMEQLKESMLEKEVEALKRKSYAEQFSDLEKRFNIALKKFDKWSDFIELSQRRNLFTHCDGVVSKQYIDICDENNYKFKVQPHIGEQLMIGPGYFNKACTIMTEVAVMLGQTLWRKLNSADLEPADSHLNSLIYDFLHIERWDKAISLSKFALGLPKYSDEVFVRMLHINYAIALKAIGAEKPAKNILDKKSWSAVSYDFKIAYAVLNSDYAEAKRLMIKAGKTADLIQESSYHDWPLFREFRETQEFLEGYEEVYGYKYLTKLRLLADKQSIEVTDVYDTEGVKRKQIKPHVIELPVQ